MVIKDGLAGDITWMESGIFLKLPLTQTAFQNSNAVEISLKSDLSAERSKLLKSPNKMCKFSGVCSPRSELVHLIDVENGKKKITCLNVQPPMSVLHLISLCCHAGTCLWIGVSCQSCGQVATIVWHHFKCCRTCKRCGARCQNHVLLITWHGHVHSCLVLKQVQYLQRTENIT